MRIVTDSSANIVDYKDMNLGVAPLHIIVGDMDYVDDDMADIHCPVYLQCGLFMNWGYSQEQRHVLLPSGSPVGWNIRNSIWYARRAEST